MFSRNPSLMNIKTFSFFLLAGAALLANTQAANPASGTIGPNSSDVVFDCTTVGAAVVEDRFILTVQPGDYTNKLVKVRISWTSPTNDYDLAIFKRLAGGVDGPQVGSSGSGIPMTEEIASINPSRTGAGDYNIVVKYFANTPGVDQPHGVISIANLDAPRVATYVKGGITFSANSWMKAPTAGQVVEPSSRCDTFGNYYIAGIRGVPAGVDLWYFDLRPTLSAALRPAAKVSRAQREPSGTFATNPNYDPLMRVPIYRGMPDSATSASPVNIEAGALGGGDIDLCVGFGNYTGTGANPLDPQPFLAYASLLAANVTNGRSTNRGATFTLNPVGNAGGGVPVNDRQWMEALGNNTVYLEYRKFENSLVFIQRSDDGGLTYQPAVNVGQLQQTGAVDVDQFDGTVYVSSSDGRVAVGTPLTPLTAPATYTTYQAVDEAINHNNLFMPVKVAEHRDANGNIIGAGIAYSVFSDGTDIYLIHSTDKGQTWSKRVSVNDQSDPATKVNLFPWLETGRADGSVGIVWYGTDASDNDDTARWKVYYAQTFNATSDTPQFRIAQASDHTIHASNISLGGFGGAANRNLADYFQLAFDPTGAAVIGYSDDHNDFAGHSFVTRQISGPSINGGNVPAPVEGSGIPANPFPAPGTTVLGGRNPQPMQPGPNGEQVTDIAQDQDVGIVGTQPSNSPYDIISIKYVAQDSNQGWILTATMTVSDLTALPPSSVWRMYLATNAPETGVIGPAGNKYSKGLSDDADQFYLQLETDQNGGRTVTWGTVERTTSGGLTLTQRGNADNSFVNAPNKSITVRIAANKFNGYLNSIGHPTIGFGSVLCGLRGQAFENVSGSGTTDSTHGGTELVIGNPF